MQTNSKEKRPGSDDVQGAEHPEGRVDGRRPEEERGCERPIGSAERNLVVVHLVCGRDDDLLPLRAGGLWHGEARELEAAALLRLGGLLLLLGDLRPRGPLALPDGRRGVVRLRALHQALLLGAHRRAQHRRCEAEAGGDARHGPPARVLLRLSPLLTGEGRVRLGSVAHLAARPGGARAARGHESRGREERRSEAAAHREATRSPGPAGERHGSALGQCRRQPLDPAS
mmetsp:Transcript_30746/g.95598  ORF Transcript_30746/g.95598 Transcript_30746/m.95598 type:complete len:229 (+) Transcript_30746:143-829(+)